MTSGILAYLRDAGLLSPDPARLRLGFAILGSFLAVNALVLATALLVRWIRGAHAAGPRTGTYRVQVGGDDLGIGRACDVARDFAASLGLDAQVAYRVSLVLEEMLSLVIRHRSEPEPFDIALVVTHDRARVIVEFGGPALDIPGWEEVRPVTSLDDVEIDLLELVILRRFARELRSERSGERNRLTATVLPAGA